MSSENNKESVLVAIGEAISSVVDAVKGLAGSKSEKEEPKEQSAVQDKAAALEQPQDALSPHHDLSASRQLQSEGAEGTPATSGLDKESSQTSHRETLPKSAEPSSLPSQQQEKKEVTPSSETGFGTSQGTHEATQEATHKGTQEATHKGTQEATHEGTHEGIQEATHKGTHEGTSQGTHEGTQEATHEGTHEATLEGTQEATHKGTHEGTQEAAHEGTHEGTHEATHEGTHEGRTEEDQQDEENEESSEEEESLGEEKDEPEPDNSKLCGLPYEEKYEKAKEVLGEPAKKVGGKRVKKHTASHITATDKEKVQKLKEKHSIMPAGTSNALITATGQVKLNPSPHPRAGTTAAKAVPSTYYPPKYPDPVHDQGAIWHTQLQGQ